VKIDSKYTYCLQDCLRSMEVLSDAVMDTVSTHIGHVKHLV